MPVSGQLAVAAEARLIQARVTGERPGVVDAAAEQLLVPGGGGPQVPVPLVQGLDAGLPSLAVSLGGRYVAGPAGRALPSTR